MFIKIIKIPRQYCVVSGNLKQPKTVNGACEQFKRAK